MSAVVRVLALGLFLSSFAEAQVRTLDVYSGAVHKLDGTVVNTLERELRRVLEPTGIGIVWQRSVSLTDAPLDPFVVGLFTGGCSVEDLSWVDASSSKKNALGEVIVNAEGTILPVFRIDCDRVIRLLYPTLSPLSPVLRRVVFGRALARVAAHEIYHIVAQASGHATEGVAKSTFVAEDLISTRFDFDAPSLQQLLTDSQPVPSSNLFGALLQPK